MAIIKQDRTVIDDIVQEAVEKATVISLTSAIQAFHVMPHAKAVEYLETLISEAEERLKALQEDK